MKLIRPSAPFQLIEPQGEALSIDTLGKVLVLPTGDPDILPLFNEYVLSSNRLVLHPGNGQIYWGRITHCNPSLDSDSNTIPDCLEASVEGSLTKFLQSYGMVI